MTSLLQFTVGNFRSIHKRCTISMKPQPIKDRPAESVVESGAFKFSTVSSIYGANSSGKSNVVLAMVNMANIVNNSVRLNDNDEIGQDPFLLAEHSKNEPTFYEIIFINKEGNARVRYGFENNKERILREWLFMAEGNKTEQTFFLRDEEGIAVNEDKFAEGVNKEENTNDNRLFLSLVAQLGGKTSKEVMSFFSSGYNVISGLSSQGYNGFTEYLFSEKQEEAASAMNLFKRLQLGFEDIDTETKDVEISLNNNIVGGKEVVPFTIHKIYSSNGDVVGDNRFKLYERESAGTEKLFKLAGPIFNTLSQGKLLVVDELDAKMHPLISQQIIQLFVDSKTNPHHAQLLFTTHDTNLLSCHLLRRDQIWFTEKNNYEATDLYNMMQIILPDGSKPRSDGNMERNYIKGRYGAIPYFHPEFED